MALFSKDLGIDLGTVYIRIAEGDKIVLEEPTVAVIDIEERLELAGLANQPELALATLAKIVQRFLSELTDPKTEAAKRLMVTK